MRVSAYSSDKAKKENNPAEVYFSVLIEQIPRLLGCLDRNRLSKTYGCFDREYWHYTTIDFSCARKQEAVLTLILIYQVDHPFNPYYRKESIQEMIESGLAFWLSIQERDGSFNEWYPKEHSFVATAFSLYALSESLILMGDEISSSLRRRAISCIERAGRWLIKRDEKRALNQVSGAAVALYNSYLLTNKEKYLLGAREKMAFIKKQQSPEGWFYEYGGADIGYLSLTIDYLAKYYCKSKDPSVLDILNRSLKFISYFVHPDLSFGGTYGSRNTEYMIPSGFEILAEKNKDAVLVSACIREALQRSATVSLANLDDRYLSYIAYNWLQAYVYARDRSLQDEAEAISRYFDSPWKRELKDAGLIVINDSKKHLVINYKKGGSFRLLLKEKGKVIIDSGIELRCGNKGMVSSWLNNGGQSTVDNDKVEVRGVFCRVPAMVMNPPRTIALRLFQMSLGRYNRAGFLIREKIRDLLVSKSRKAKHTFHRTIYLRALTVEDTVFINGPVDRLIVGTKSSYTSIPSSRYFQAGDELLEPLVLAEKELKNRNSLTLFRNLEKEDCSILDSERPGGNITKRSKAL